MVLVVPERKTIKYWKMIEHDQDLVYPVTWRPFYKFFTLPQAAALLRISKARLISLLYASKTIYAFRAGGTFYIHPDGFIKFVKNRLVRRANHLAT